MMSGVHPRNWIKSHSVSLGLAIRIVVASVSTFIVCQILGLNSQWAVLTAIIVMQSSVGASLKATFDRFAGSIGGAFWGVCILVALPRDTPLAIGVALAATLVPLAAIAAFHLPYRIAPITGVILLLTPMPPDMAPWMIGFERVFEVGIGSLVAVGVALVVLPVRARDALTRAAGDTIFLLADLLEELSKSMAGNGNPGKITLLHHDIRHALTRAEDIAEEAVRERMSHLVHAPDPLPLCRTLRRLRHDLTMIGRIVDTPFWSPLVAPVTQTAQSTAGVIVTYLRNNVDALANRQLAPSMDDVEQALADHAAAVAEVRRTGGTRDLHDEEAGRIFGLSFGFAQLNRDLMDLAARTDELADTKVKRGPKHTA